MRLSVRLKPRAKSNALTETLADGTLKISLTAPAINDRANAALVDFLSEHYDVAKSRVRIVQGQHNRNKIVEIAD